MLLSIVSGVLLSAAFPPGGMEWIVWFGLIPLLFSIQDETRSNAFKLGMIAGMAHYLTLIYWIIVVLHTYGGLSYIISVSALILLSLYLSAYFGLFSILIHYFREFRLRVLPAGCIWVFLEYVRGQFLTGFPWCLLGHSQFEQTGLIQVADTIGVYGITFLIVVVNSLIYHLFMNHRLVFRHRWLLWEAAIVVFMVVMVTAYGRIRLQGPLISGEDHFPIRIAVVQGNIDQSLKWDKAFQARTIDRYRALTRSTYDFRPELIVWPETSVPLFFQNKTALSDEVVEIGREAQASLVFGSPAYEKNTHGTRYYNRAYLLSPDGDVTDYYDKVHLVPFGEYVPLRRLFPFINRLVQAAGDFTAGRAKRPLQYRSLSAGVLVCFEGIFPELSRAQVKNGATSLVNITNDAWYGMTSAPYQLLMMSAFRAVENRRWLIRSANTGISAFVDPYGRIVKRTSLFTEAVLTQTISPVSGFTFYTRYGDVFVYIILVICLMLFISRRIK